MKKKFLLVASFAILSFCAVNAQGGGGGGMQRMPIPERVKMIMDKLADFKLDKDKTALTDSTFTGYFRSQEKAMQDMRDAGGTPDREKMMETRKKLMDERDEKLKKIFTEEQFKKWKEEIEPTTRPQRPAGGSNSGN
jgi:periplasmic protein CpxP/Spy